MRVFPPQYEVVKGSGFGKDLFSLQKFGDDLKNFLLKTTDCLVVGLDADWGSGKTTFLRMWADHLSKENVYVIYINFFEYDHVDDPFSVIFSHIESLIDEKLHDDQ